MMVISTDETPLDIVLALHNRMHHLRGMSGRTEGAQRVSVMLEMDELLEQYRFMLEVHTMFESMMDPSYELSSADLRTSST
jgi:hypothetical protein